MIILIFLVAVLFSFGVGVRIGYIFAIRLASRIVDEALKEEV